MGRFSDHDAALIDDIRKELKKDATPAETLKFEVAVARVIAARLAEKVKSKKKKVEDVISD